MILSHWDYLSWILNIFASQILFLRGNIYLLFCTLLQISRMFPYKNLMHRKSGLFQLSFVQFHCSSAILFTVLAISCTWKNFYIFNTLVSVILLLHSMILVFGDLGVDSKPTILKFWIEALKLLRRFPVI